MNYPPATTDKQEAPFFGREQITEQIIRLLLDLDADKKNHSSVMVEGPGGRGKTRLLDHVCALLIAPAYNAQVVVCAWSVTPTFEHLPNDERRWHKLIAMLCQHLRDHSAFAQTDWPLDLEQPSASEAQWEAAIHAYPAENLLADIARRLGEANILCLLVVDGIEEMSAELCTDFETKLLVPLFRTPLMRLLASRRVDNVTHRWRKHVIRSKTRVRPLESFDDEVGHAVGTVTAPFSSNDPRTQQIGFVLGSAGLSPKESEEHGSRFLDDKQGRAYYSWGNPGLNECLAQGALAHPSHQFTRELVERCLRGRLTAPQPELAPPNPAWNDAFIFDALQRIVKQHGSAIQSGVERLSLAESLGMAFNDASKFLGHLQSCGVGTNNSNATFSCHREFVELFLWLPKLT